MEVKKFDSDSLAPVVEGTITETNLRKESTSPSGDEVLNGSDLPPGNAFNIMTSCKWLVIHFFFMKMNRSSAKYMCNVCVLFLGI